MALRKQILSVLLAGVMMATSVPFTPLTEIDAAQTTGTFASGYFDSLTNAEKEEFQTAYLKGFVTEELMRKKNVDEAVTDGEFRRLLLNTEEAMGIETGSRAQTFDGTKYDFAAYVAEGDDKTTITRYAASNMLLYQFHYKELNREWTISDIILDTYGTNVWRREYAEATERGNDISSDVRSTLDFIRYNMDSTSGLALMDLYQDGYFKPEEALTVETAVQLVYRYSNMYVSSERTYTYADLLSAEATNPLVLTDSELAMAKSVPEMVYDDMPDYNQTYYGSYANYNYAFESDFRVMSELGINFVTFDVNRSLISDDGQLWMEELEVLDCAVRYAAKYGIHLMIELDVGDYGYVFGTYSIEGKSVADGQTVQGFGTNTFTAEEYVEYEKKVWKTLALRYQNVPNNLISFLLFNEPPVFSSELRTTYDEKYRDVCYAIADEIWSVTPGRKIITDGLEGGEYPSYAIAEEGLRRNKANAGKSDYFDQRIFQAAQTLGEWTSGFYGEAPTVATDYYVIPEAMYQYMNATYTINANSDGFSAGTKVRVRSSNNDFSSDNLKLTSYDASGAVVEEDISVTYEGDNDVYADFTLKKDAAKLVLSKKDDTISYFLKYIWITYPETADEKIPISGYYRDSYINNYGTFTKLYEFEDYPGYAAVGANSASDLIQTYIARYESRKTTYIYASSSGTLHGVNNGFQGDDTYCDLFFTGDTTINIQEGNDNQNYTASFYGDADGDGKAETEYSLTYAQFLDQKMDKWKNFTDKYNTTIINHEMGQCFSLEKKDYLQFWKDQLDNNKKHGSTSTIFFYCNSNNGLMDAPVIGGDNIYYEKYYVDKDMLELYQSYFESFTIDAVADQAYTGKQIKPTLSVKYKGKTLTQGTDYDIVYGDNTDYGTGTALVVGKGTYAGIYSTGTFLISALGENLRTKSCAITVSKTSYTKTASTKAQSFTLGAKTSAGKLTYKSSNKKVTVSSKGKVTIAKNFAGTATITVTAQKTNYRTATKKITITVNPAAVSIKTLKSGKSKQISLTWSKNTYVTGYQIQYSISKSFSSKKTKTVKISSAKTTTKTIRKLAAKKKYYVRIRSYKTVNKKNYYSSWSKVKSTTTMK